MAAAPINYDSLVQANLQRVLANTMAGGVPRRFENSPQRGNGQRHVKVEASQIAQDAYFRNNFFSAAPKPAPAAS